MIKEGTPEGEEFLRVMEKAKKIINNNQHWTQWGKRDPIVHCIKCDEPFFTDIDNYIKTFELRLNDRDYRKGDFLIIERTKNSGETKEVIYASIEYFLEGYPGLQNGYCILGIDKLKTVEIKNDNRC